MTDAPGIETTEGQPAETLKEQYGRLGEEFRQLGRRQLNSGLTPEENLRRQELQKMASSGLLDKSQSEPRLRELDRIYQLHTQAEAAELADPLLAKEYRILGKELYENGLRPEGLARYNHLDMLARAGKLELRGQPKP